MKFRVWELIVLTSLFVASIVFSSLHSQWSGFVYFTMSTLLLFSGFFINNRIYYIRYLKKEYDNGLSTYFTELYNHNMITREQYQARDERIVNGYYKNFNKSKLTNIIIIVVLALVSLSGAMVVFGIW